MSSHTVLSSLSRQDVQKLIAALDACSFGDAAGGEAATRLLSGCGRSIGRQLEERQIQASATETAELVRNRSARLDALLVAPPRESGAALSRVLAETDGLVAQASLVEARAREAREAADAAAHRRILVARTASSLLVSRQVQTALLADLTVLQSDEAGGCLSFWQALEQVTAMRDWVPLLLADERASSSAHGTTSLAMALLEYTSVATERATRRVYRHVRDFLASQADRPAVAAVAAADDELRTFSAAALPHCFIALRSNVALLRPVLADMVAARSVRLARAFLHQLTGRRGASPIVDTDIRPIELLAHDPVRYASDMLSWTLQAAAAEADLLRVVLGETLASDAAAQAGEAERIARSVGDEAGAQRAAAAAAAATAVAVAVRADARALLSLVFTGVAGPLAARIDQSLVSSPGPLVLLRLVRLVDFYGEKFAPLLEASPADVAAADGQPVPDEAESAVPTEPVGGSDVTLSLLCPSVTQSLTARLFSSLRTAGRLLVSPPPAPSGRLGTPTPVRRHLQLTRDIIELVATMPSATPGQPSPASSRATSPAFVPLSSSLSTDLLLDLLMDPVTESIEKSGETFYATNPSERAVFLANCWSSVCSSVTGVAGAGEAVRRAADRAAATLDEATSALVEQLTSKVSLTPETYQEVAAAAGADSSTTASLLSRLESRRVATKVRQRWLDHLVAVYTTMRSEAGGDGAGLLSIAEFRRLVGATD